MAQVSSSLGRARASLVNRMLFDSTVYLVFLAAITLVYWRLPHHGQNWFLLVASYVFYGWWDYRFLGLMGLSTVVDYVVGQQIVASESARARRMLFIGSIVLNLSFLGFFKYFGFFVDSAIALAAAVGLSGIPDVVFRVALPPAISFYTFQEIAYIVDVYHGRLKPATSLRDYALFVSLFPHLIAGPIQRPSHLLPQVEEPRSWQGDKAFDGVMLILEGLLRKVVVADNLALVANAAFSGGLGPPSLATVLIGAYAFAGQIYGDFSGYSSMARGSAQLLGFHFMVNFRQPYLAQSLQDFWRRWHISLSTWLRDYLYIPLGGSRMGEARTYRNLLTTMLLGGLWHGANWTFVVWGFAHGAGLALERAGGAALAADAGSFWSRWARRFVVFHVVCLAWVFFRAASVTEAVTALSALTQLQWHALHATAAVFLGVLMALMLALDLRLEQTGEEYAGATSAYAVRVAAAVAVCILIALAGANQTNAFIYFQF